MSSPHIQNLSSSVTVSTPRLLMQQLHLFTSHTDAHHAEMYDIELVFLEYLHHCMLCMVL